MKEMHVSFPDRYSPKLKPNTWQALKPSKNARLYANSMLITHSRRTAALKLGKLRPTLCSIWNLPRTIVILQSSINMLWKKEQRAANSSKQMWRHHENKRGHDTLKKFGLPHLIPSRYRLVPANTHLSFTGINICSLHLAHVQISGLL